MRRVRARRVGLTSADGLGGAEHDLLIVMVGVCSCAWASVSWTWLCSWIRLTPSEKVAIGEYSVRRCPRRRTGGPPRRPGSDRRSRRAHPGRASPCTIVLPVRVELHDQLDQPLLRPRIERRRRLVEQQHVRVHREHRRDRDTFLLPARELEGRAVRRCRRCRACSDVVDPPLDLLPRPAELQRSERDLFAHGR